MKTKKGSFGKAFLSKKRFALVEIAIVLCSVFLVALPTIAAQEQDQAMQKVSANEVTTASGDDYVLGIYGNANEDETIDIGDVVYTKLAIFGKKPKTELCDAKYDERINVLDVIQTKLIILGKEKELTVIDQADRIVTVKKPSERIVTTTRGILEVARAIKLEKERIVGVESKCQKGAYKIFFPEYQDTSIITRADAESILKLYPDLVLLFVRTSADQRTQDVLESAGITVFRAHGGGAYDIDRFAEEAIKFGYIFDKEDEAEEYLDWREEILNSIKEVVEKIPEEDKPKVYFETTKYSISDEVRTHVARTGGKNIFEGMSGKVDSEAVVKRNPDIIIQVTWYGSGGMEVGGYDGYEMDVGDTTKLKEMRDEIMNRPELQDVTAVKERSVYILSSYITSWGPTAGCRSFIQDAYMAKWFHPELFEDINPKAIHQEYLTRFCGLDIDLDEKGVFVYHPDGHPDGH